MNPSVTSTAAPQSVKLIVFDWDGTLMDSTGAIAESIRDAARDLGLAVPSKEQAAYVIGLGLRDALNQVVPDLTAAQGPEFSARYREHFTRRHAQWTPFDGIPEMLAALAGGPVPLAIATGKSRSGLDVALDRVNWRELFVTTRCADQGQPKPDPWMLNDICDELAIAPADVVMIGDTTHDLLMAEQAGAQSIAVTYGAHDAQSLREASTLAVIDDVPALHALLESLTAK